MVRFGPSGASKLFSVSSVSDRTALPTLPATDAAVALVSLQPQQSVWWVKFGDSSVVASITDAIRCVPGSKEDPLVLAITGSPTHIAILAEGEPGDVIVTSGLITRGTFAPSGTGSALAVTQSTQAVALPTLPSTRPAISLVATQAQMEALWVTFGTSGSVTASRTTSMRVFPGSSDAPTLLRVPAGSTHLAVLCDGEPGDVILTPGQMAQLAVAAADVNNVLVTDLKIAASPRIIGLDTGSNAAAKELTLSQVLDFIGSAAQGDILYRGASAWARLAAATLNQRLLTKGSGDNPAWGSGSVTLASGSISAGANFDLTSISQVYQAIFLQMLGLSHNSGSNQTARVFASNNNGSSYISTGYRAGARVQSAGTTNVATSTDNFLSLPSIAAGGSYNVNLMIFNYAGLIPHYFCGVDQVGTAYFTSSGQFLDGSAINALRTNFSAGNIDAGTYTLVGLL